MSDWNDKESVVSVRWYYTIHLRKAALHIITSNVTCSRHDLGDTFAHFGVNQQSLTNMYVLNIISCAQSQTLQEPNLEILKNRPKKPQRFVKTKVNIIMHSSK